MSATHGVSPINRHDEYYLRDGNICFLVENTLFRLHRYFFERESRYFRERLSPSIDSDADGTPDSPYKIHDVRVAEFSQFVSTWYSPTYSYSRKRKEHWLLILRLATQWEFHEIKNLAIRQLEKLNLQPIEKISIYKQYKVNPELLLPSYVSLCRDENLPSPEEGEILTMGTVLRLASAREQILLSVSESGCKTPTTASAPDDVTRAIIAKLFELSLHSNQTVKAEGHVVNGNVSGKTSVDTEIITIKKPTKQVELPSQNGLSGSNKGKNK